MNPKDKAIRLRARARQFRELAAVSTNGGRMEDAILRAIADRLDEEAEALEREAAG